MDNQTQTQLEAAAFRRMVAHLQNRTDVQNIDLMNLSGFCRNCLSRWYLEEAVVMGVDLDKEQSQNVIYGMPYAEWKDKYQEKASKDQLKSFEENKPTDN